MKKLRQCIALLVVAAMIFGLCISANAKDTKPAEGAAKTAVVARAIGRFNMEVPANELLTASTAISLQAGERVTISATYTPKTASVDFGLMDEDGVFYYFTASDGSLDKTMAIVDSGNYIFTVRNHSSVAVNVSGYINY